METKSNSVSIPAADELLEIKKPTSLLIAQFFLFPLIIIAICIGIFLLFGYLTYEQKTPQEYLNEVRTGSELCCKWQSARCADDPLSFHGSLDVLPNPLGVTTSRDCPVPSKTLTVMTALLLVTSEGG